MLINIQRDSAREHRRLVVAGIGFLVTIALLIGLSIAIYNKTFERSTMITIQADRAGLQLAKFGDVRRNGVLVGQVRRIDQNGQQAEITVALDPDEARNVPENVEVQILPTTLFGQKFISLVSPAEPSSRAIADHAVIPASRVETNVELSRILSELFPLLRSVRPADLNATLTALATALEGRGDDLGSTLDDLGDYLGEIEASLPTLRADLIALADVADIYDEAAPDLLRVLDNLTVTAGTVLDERGQLPEFFSGVTELADTGARILGDHGDALIRVGDLSVPVIGLLETYSPELPCLLKGAARYAPILSKTFEGNRVKQYIEFGTAQYRAYDEDDLPEYGEVGHGPWCSGLPNPPVPIGPNSFDDGTDIDDHPPTSPLPQLPLPRAATGFGGSLAPSSLSSGYAGTEAEQQVLNAILAGRTGEAPDSYGSLGALLFGPVVRGEVR